MDQLAYLIGKLKEQFEEKADPAQLLMTTQLIEAELIRVSARPRPATVSSKVAVVMPTASRVIAQQPAPVQETTAVAPPPPPPPPPAPAPIEKAPEPEPVEKEDPPVTNGRNFNPLTEIPTLAHQQSIKELNESMSTPGHSVNDRLKEEKIELGHKLHNTPVRDLRKAVGVNDRYTFISELFRGDETMYERSIKTINGFHAYQEALYWMERELKIKLGWDEDNRVTQEFYQLVNRRFS